MVMAVNTVISGADQTFCATSPVSIWAIRSSTAPEARNASAISTVEPASTRAESTSLPLVTS